MIFFCAIMHAFLNGTAALIIKKKLMNFQINKVQEFVFFFMDPLIIFACFLILFSMYFSTRTLSYSKFTVGIPLIYALNFIYTIFLGMAFLGETINLQGCLGLILIIMGIVLLTRGQLI